jgi:putative protease
MNSIKKPILLSPVGSWEMLSSAINAGCDTVYLGIKGLNMRDTGAKNFSLSDLKKITNICHLKKVLVYLTVNTIIYENETKKVEKILIAAKESKIDGIIAWDFSVISLCKKHKLPIYLSTQASVSNFESIKQYHKLGVKRFVLARECTLSQVKEITKKAKKLDKNIQIEVFIHGAMCVSVSGRCFLSQFLYGNETSANRGKCIQPCRRNYIIKDPETEKELDVHNNYILSPKDLCTMPFIDKLIESGVNIFKIEGRGRSPEYVSIVTSCYREAIDAYYNNKLTSTLKDKLVKRLELVYNKGFSSGFYLGKPINEWAETYGTLATKKKTYIAKILNIYKKINVAEIKLENGPLKIGDTILIIGKNTGVHEQRIESIQKDVSHPLKIANKGDIVAIKLTKMVEKQDLIYLFK